jgi:6-phosphofructokinase 1
VLQGITVYGREFVGFKDGWRGVMEADVMPLPRFSVRGISKQGGTILGTSRTNHRDSSSGRGQNSLVGQ